jgi:hypothetical protein
VPITEVGEHITGQIERVRLASSARIGRAVTISVERAGAAGWWVNPDVDGTSRCGMTGASISTISVSDGGVVTFTTDGGTARSAGARLEILFVP